jgi:hypothetical protein
MCWVVLSSSVVKAGEEEDEGELANEGKYRCSGT